MDIYWIMLTVFVASSNALPAAPRVQEYNKKSLDIAFLIESSHLIKKQDFQQAKEGISYLVDKMTTDSQIAVLSFNTNPKMVFNFKSLHQHKDAERMKAIQLLIETIPGPFNGTHTFIDRALNMTNEEIFTEANGMRPDVRKVAVVFTSGVQTRNKGNYTDLYIASEPLKVKGIDVFTFGFGNDVDVLNLIHISSSVDNVYSISNLMREPKENNNVANDVLGNECPRG